MRYYLLVIAAVSYFAYVNCAGCVQCNSATDPRCATNPNQYMAKDCANSTSRCYVRVLNGNTIRGCTSELDNNTLSRCNNENECIACAYSEGCNNQPFPTHRLQCVQCEGNSTGTCALDTRATPTICPIFKLGDKCYIRNNGRNQTNSFRRGCLSTAQQDQKVCIKPGNCFDCDGHGCNNLDFNDSIIPLARDSAGIFGYSLGLLLAAFLAVRYA